MAGNLLAKVRNTIVKIFEDPRKTRVREFVKVIDESLDCFGKIGVIFSIFDINGKNYQTVIFRDGTGRVLCYTGETNNSLCYFRDSPPKEELSDGARRNWDNLWNRALHDPYFFI